MLEIMVLSGMAGLATVVGALIILAFGKPSEKNLAIFFGLAAGIMLSVALLDLVPSSVSYGSYNSLLTGSLFGLVLLKILSFILQPDKLPSSTRGEIYLRRMGYLIAIGIALHDLPEGIAIAAGFSATVNLGWKIGVAIGLHNIPEGMIAAAPLLMSGLPPGSILFILGIVSLFTPLGTLLGLLIVSLSRTYISFLLAMAAGAMIYIVLFEIIPESKKRHPNYARLGMVLGFLLIFFLRFIE
jgi:ZIP family zinc transporter